MEGTEKEKPGERPRKKSARRWLWVFIGFAIILLAGFYYLHGDDDSGPDYRGEKFSHWLRMRRDPKAIDAALIKIGPVAIPVLTRAVGKQDSFLGKKWRTIWPKLSAGWRKRLSRYQPASPDEVRENAYVGLGKFGPEAESAVPAVVQAARREKDLMLQAYAITAVMEIGQDSPVAREFLLEELRGTNRMARAQVTANIYTCHFMLPGAVPSLLQAFGDSNQKPINEELALSVVGAEGAEAMPLIAKQLDDPKMPTNPLLALAGIGTNLGPAVPGLIRIVQTGSPLFRVDAAEALMRAGSDAREALPALARAQQDKDPVVGCMATVAAARIQNDPALAMPLLIQELEQTNSIRGEGFWVMTRQLKGPQELINISFHDRETAAWLLGEAGSAGQPALPALTNAMRRSHSWMRPITARAIFKITGDADAVMPALRETLKSKDDIACFLAMTVLREMGAKARPAKPELEALKTRDMNLRRAAFETLKAIEADKKP